MNATCRWVVNATCVDKSDMLSAIRKDLPKESQEGWIQRFVDGMDPCDDHEEYSDDFSCSFSVNKINDLALALRLMYVSKASGVRVCCYIEHPSIGASAWIGTEANAELHQKPYEHDIARNTITEIERLLDKLREHVMSVKEKS